MKKEHEKDSCVKATKSFVQGMTCLAQKNRYSQISSLNIHYSRILKIRVRFFDNEKIIDFLVIFVFMLFFTNGTLADALLESLPTSKGVIVFKSKVTKN